jgi:AcrR family transcriptional regulator
MTAQPRKRNDPRREMTRIALIEAAESLFAEAGVDAVSTRQIGAAIGSANTNVVAYHFGGKEELILAVYRHRLPTIDRRRGELLDEADAAGKGGDLAMLIRAFALPLFEQVDGAGRHSYARFIQGIERSGRGALRAGVVQEFPQTERLNQRIADLLALGSGARFNRRMRLAASLLVAALQLIDQEAAAGDPTAEMFDEAIAMAVAAMAVGTQERQ